MRRAKRMSAHPPELNLVPLLDMVSLLIQLMLINAQFGSYAELPGSAAVQIPGKPEGEPLSLRVIVAPEGYEVGWLEGGAKQSRTLPCPVSPCADGSTYDTAGLRTLAGELKQRFPAETSVVVAPRGPVIYDAVVVTMDSLRTQGQPPQPLFPEVVFAGGSR